MRSLLVAALVASATALGQTDPQLSVATTSDTTLYVRIGGNDRNPCTLQAPCATPQAAYNKLPKIIRHKVTLDIGPGDFYSIRKPTETTTGTNQPRPPVVTLSMRGTVVDQGFPRAANTVGSFAFLHVDGAMVPVTASYVATGGSGTNPTATVAKTGAGWTVDAYKGMFVEFQTSSMTGYIDRAFGWQTNRNLAVIESNTSDTITFVQPWAAKTAASGVTFRVVKPGTVLHAESGPSTWDTTAIGSVAFEAVNVGGGMSDYEPGIDWVDGTGVMVRYIDFKVGIAPPAATEFGAVRLANSGVRFSAVRVINGTATAGSPTFAAYESNGTSLYDSYVEGTDNSYSCVFYDGMQCVSGLFGVFVNCSSSVSALRIQGAGTRLYVQGSYTNTGTGHAIWAAYNAQAFTAYAQSAKVTAGSSGSGVRVQDWSTYYASYPVTGTAPRYAAEVTRGGRAVLWQTPTVVGTLGDLMVETAAYAYTDLSGAVPKTITDFGTGSMITQQ